MKVYYDDQIFRYQTTGGIKNYFINLISTFSQNPELGIEPIYSDYIHDALLLNFKSNFSKASRGDLLFNTIKMKFFRNSLPNCDLIHHTFYFKSYFNSTRAIPTISTIHDMIPEKMPNRFVMNPHFSKNFYIRNSDQLITVSDTTKRHLLEFFPSAKNKSKSIYLGYTDDPKIEIVDNYHNFFLYVGQRNSYKKATDLYHAFSKMSNSNRTKLVLVGGEELSRSEITLMIKLDILHKVRRIVPNNDQLNYLLKNAVALICTSESEGFHIPTLEALRLGTPAIVRDIEIFNELYGDNVLKFSKIDHLSHIMRTLLERDYSIPEPLSLNLSEFSWMNCARKTSEIYKNICL